MNREQVLAQERATEEIRRNRERERVEKDISDRKAAAQFSKERDSVEREAEKYRAQIKRGWEECAKIKPLATKAVARLQKAIDELVAADEECEKQFHALYHSCPKHDGTIYQDSPLSPFRRMNWLRMNLFKIAEKRFRWATKTGFSPVEIKTLAEEANPAIDWVFNFKEIKAANQPRISPESVDDLE